MKRTYRGKQRVWGVTPARRAAIAALLTLGKNSAKIAKEERVSYSTIVKIKREEKWSPEIIENIKSRLAGKFYHATDRALFSLDDEKLSSATAQQLAMTAAICVDKARLLEGSSSQIIEIRNKREDEIESELDVLRRESIDATVDEKAEGKNEI